MREEHRERLILSVRPFIRGYLARRLPAQVVEDVLQEVCLGVMEWIDRQPEAVDERACLRVAYTIARRRRADLLRARGAAAVLEVDQEADDLEQNGHRERDTLSAVEQRERQAYLREFVPMLMKALVEVTPPGTPDRALVERYLQSLCEGAPIASLRQVGSDLWPKRPQTACEHMKDIVRDAVRWLEDRGFGLPGDS